MHQNNERDNYSRISGLLHDNATPICGKLMEQHLKRINKSFPDFIDDHQHDIFHFYSYKTCCVCKDSPSCKSILRKKQIMILFETDDKSQRRRGHMHQKNKNLCCCFAKKNIKVDDLDFTLLKFMLINFCEDEFWCCFLVSCQNSFEDFLDKQRHNLFHIWQPRCACCMCRTGYVRPNANFIDNQQFRKLFIKAQAVCSTPSHNFHSCIYKAEPGLTYKELKQRDLRLLYSLTNYFCPLRKCIETLGDRRNDVVAHTVSAKISCDDFDVLWRGMVKCILEIAVAVDFKTEAEKRIDYQKTGPLDMNMCAQWQTELLAEINQKEELADEIKDTKDIVQFGLEVIDAKMDKSIENDACLRNLLKETCHSLMQSIEEGKKQRELEKEQILNHREQVNITVLNGPTINANFNARNTFKAKRGTSNNHILENNNNEKIVCRQNKTPSTPECSTDETGLQVPEIPNDVKGARGYIVEFTVLTHFPPNRSSMFWARVVVLITTKKLFPSIYGSRYEHRTVQMQHRNTSPEPFKSHAQQLLANYRQTIMT